MASSREVGWSSMLVLFFVLPALSDGAGAPAMFIFGDSLIDNGNNNFIPSVARANYEPYGIDFGSPTGRFCNGLTVTDFGAKFLGLPFPPPYLSLAAKAGDILGGVNYASAAAGILDDTGKHYGARITFNGQIELFEKTVATQLPLLMPVAAARSEFLARSVFIVNIGSNDYINNYLMPAIYPTSRVFSGEAFADLLIFTLSQQILSLYKLGARKIVVVGAGPLGCIPSQLARNSSSDGRCVDGINILVAAFNRRAVALTATLNATLPGSFFVYQNIYNTFFDMIQNPDAYGFDITNEACCGNGKYGGEVSCLPLQQPCTARTQYIFWDSFHPTEAANAVIATRCYAPSSAVNDCSPVSIYDLAQI